MTKEKQPCVLFPQHTDLRILTKRSREEQKEPRKGIWGTLAKVGRKFSISGKEAGDKKMSGLEYGKGNDGAVLRDESAGEKGVGDRKVAQNMLNM